MWKGGGNGLREREAEETEGEDKKWKEADRGGKE